MQTALVKATFPRYNDGEVINLTDDMPTPRVIRETLADIFEDGVELPILSGGAARDRNILIREAGKYKFVTYDAASESRGGKVVNAESARNNVQRYIRVFGSKISGIPDGLRITVSANDLGEVREYESGQAKQNEGEVIFYLSPA